ncbi:hypothetical protein FRC09_007848 [Ceratobasidium sp. 395]|nr:hypothetical protein FRC09_007848 [Ceratobasidium sp. 395]
MKPLPPWIACRITRDDRVDTKGSWTTGQTIAQRMVLDIPLGDLLPAPEFDADVRGALQKATNFDKFAALNKTFELWGDVLPVVYEFGAFLAISDTSSNFNKLSAIDFDQELKDLCAHPTARVNFRGGDTNLGTTIANWLSQRGRPSQWTLARVIQVIPTTDLLQDELKDKILELYMALLSYRPQVLSSGGARTKSFDGTPYAMKQIENIVVYSGASVDSVTTEYPDGVSSGRQGGPGGHKQVFSLTKGEFIIEVLVWESEYTRGIQFMTNTGRISAHFGQNNGKPNVLSSEDGVLVALSGKLSLESYQKYDVLYRIQTIWRHDILRTAATRKHVYSIYFGGSGGAPFNDWPYLYPSDVAHISGIKVGCGSLVDSIQVSYSRSYNEKTSNWEGGRHGGGGGRHEAFWLKPGEYIIKVKGRGASLIDQLCFVTNHGRSSGTYGGGGGRAFECEAPTGSNGERMRLCFIIGKSGGTLDGILFAWAPV